MPSNANYKRDYKQEYKTSKARDAKKKNKNATEAHSRVVTKQKRRDARAAGKPIPKSKDVTHVGKPAKAGGTKTSVGSRSANRAAGGRSGNTAGKAAGARKGHASRRKG